MGATESNLKPETTILPIDIPPKLETIIKKIENSEEYVVTNYYNSDSMYLFFIAYRFDSWCSHNILLPELINFIINISPQIEFDNLSGHNSLSYLKENRKNRIVSGPSIGGWASTKKLRNYIGPITFKFKQSFIQASNNKKLWTQKWVWSVIGISSVTNEWGASGCNFQKNSKCEFFYRLDQGLVHCKALENIEPSDELKHRQGGYRHFPRIINDISSETIVTLMFERGRVKLIKCNKFDVALLDNNRWYPIPEEYYIMVDLYYCGTYCAIYGNDGEKLYTSAHSKSTSS
jgi:hypothetical protein